jgi:ankyrin repeat protein
VELIIVLSPLSVSLLTIEGQTALHLASHNGHTAVIETLFKAGADVDLVTPEGWNALHFACIKAHETAALCLMDAMTSLNAKTILEGATALHLACESGSWGIAYGLLKGGSDVHATDLTGRVPLHRACQAEDSSLALLLVQYHASLDAVDEVGIYFSISRNGYGPLVRLSRTDYGISLCPFAVQSLRTDIIRYVLGSANPN